MTPEDIDKLTIGEVRAIAERASAALDTLRALGVVVPPVAAPAVSSPPSPHDVPMPDAHAVALAAWRADPERQRLLDLNRNKPEEAGEDFERTQ